MNLALATALEVLLVGSLAMQGRWCAVPGAGFLLRDFAGLGAYHLPQDLRSIWILLATCETLAGSSGIRFHLSGNTCLKV